MISFFNLETEEIMEMDYEEVYAIVSKNNEIIVMAANGQDYRTVRVNVI